MSDPNEYQNLRQAAASLPGNLEDQARAFQEAAASLGSRDGEDSNSTSPEIRQGTALEKWARQNDLLISTESIDLLQLVSNSTSEHEVHYRASDHRAVKRTWAGFYGQVPTPENGKLGRKNATPSEYLLRMALQIAVFESDLKLEGVSVSDRPSMIIGRPAGEPSLVISQEWFEKQAAPSLDEIAERMRLEKFLPVANSYFGWFREEDGVMVVDAKPDNFVKTSVGLVALDLQMKQFSREEMKAAGLI